MWENKVLKIELQELFYLGFVAVMFFGKGIGLYDGQLAYKLLLVLALSLAGAKLFVTQYTVKEWILVFVTLVFTAVLYLNCKEKGIVICILTILLMKDTALDKVFRTGLWVWGLIMCGNILFHLLNLESSGYKVHNKLGMELIFRWDLGFSHPNVLHISYLVLAGLIIYNLKKPFGWKQFLILTMGNIFIFLYSVSYTGFLVTMIYLVLSWYAEKRENLSKIEYWILGTVFPISLILSFFSVYFLSGKVFHLVNKIFNNRLILAKYYVIPENIKMLGNNLERITTSMYTLDNSYLFSFIIYGIIVFIMLVFLYTFTIRDMMKKEKKKEIVLTVCMLIAGITEPFLFNTSFKNLTLFFLGAYLWEALGKKKEEKEIGFFVKQGKRVVRLNAEKFLPVTESLYTVWHKHKRKILVYSISLSVVIGSVYGTMKEMPKAYIVPRVHADVRQVIEEKNLWCLDNPEDPIYQDVMILDYIDETTYMEYIDGDALGMERIRLYISSILLLGVLFTGMGITVTAIKDRKA